MSRKELGAIGSQRTSLSSNPLLIQDEVGKPRRRCMTLPPSNFTYGAQNISIDGGVAQAISDWKCHIPSYIAKTKKPQKDFMALNKAAIQSGLTTAQEQQHYRATHDLRRRDKSRSKKKGLTFPDDMVFGMANRPSSPIYHLLENRYQEEWLEGRKEEDRKRIEAEMERKLSGKVYETRASLLRRFSEPVDPAPDWKMDRWSRVPGHLETFRSERERSGAFDHHASDSVARTGLFGHGIYQAAKS